jgi:hypothetical protein
VVTAPYLPWRHKRRSRICRIQTLRVYSFLIDGCTPPACRMTGDSDVDSAMSRDTGVNSNRPSSTSASRSTRLRLSAGHLPASRSPPRACRVGPSRTGCRGPSVRYRAAGRPERPPAARPSQARGRLRDDAGPHSAKPEISATAPRYCQRSRGRTTTERPAL